MSDPRDQLVMASLRNHLDIAVEALTKIANMDYRGNRSNESVLAYQAIQKITKKRQESGVTP